MKVYDAFPLFNELDLLRVRLVEHDPFVDRFILIEADRTHTGRPKPYYFDPADPRFAPFAGKIIQRKRSAACWKALVTSTAGCRMKMPSNCSSACPVAAPKTARL